LSQIHPYAKRAAEAAEAAGAQGQFWEMHEILYANQDALDDADLAEYAAQIGLDLPRFIRDLASGAFKDRVQEDFLSGVVSGVNGTPSFFINELRYDGPWDLASLEHVVRSSAGSRIPVSRGGHR
jgi:protein-disulfide isomerase